MFIALRAQLCAPCYAMPVMDAQSNVVSSSLVHPVKQ